MTNAEIDAVLESVRSWPPEDQEELIEIAREIEARRTGIYVMSEEERAAVNEGLDQARRGEFVPDDEMDAFWKRYGVVGEFDIPRVHAVISKRFTDI
jgi:predicted transcriptional regulator